MKKDYRIRWCLKQQRGISNIKINDDLSKVYIRKAFGSLKMLKAAVENEENEWIATTAYYAMYFSSYAILVKSGVKSEIHDCTIKLLKLFSELKKN